MAMQTELTPTKAVRFGLGAKILTWVIVPLILMVTLNVVSIAYLMGNSNSAIGEQAEIIDADHRIMASTNRMTEALLRVNKAMVDLEALRRDNLANRRFNPEPEVAARTELIEAARAFQGSIIGFTSVLQAAQVDDAQTLRQVTSLTRAAGQLDRLVSLYVVSNSRTLRLAADGQFEAASSNFAFEEVQRIEALRAQSRLASTRFVSLSNTVSDSLQVTSARARGAAAAKQARTQRLAYGTAAGIGLLFLIATTSFVRLSIIRPIKRIPPLILALGEAGQGGADAMPRRRDEIGAILGAVEQFRQRIEDDKRREEAERNARMAQQEKVVTELATGLQALSRKRIALRIDADLGQEYNALRDNFNRATDSLDTALSEIGAATDRFHQRAGGISESSETLSEKTQMAAASLEQTAAALDQLNSSLQGSAKSAQEVAGFTKTAGQSRFRSLR